MSRFCPACRPGDPCAPGRSAGWHGKPGQEDRQSPTKRSSPVRKYCAWLLSGLVTVVGLAGNVAAQYPARHYPCPPGYPSLPTVPPGTQPVPPGTQPAPSVTQPGTPAEPTPGTAATPATDGQ